MTELSRREALAAAAIAGLVATMPAWAQDARPAQWDLTDLYPSDAAWDERARRRWPTFPASPSTRARWARAPTRSPRPDRAVRHRPRVEPRLHLCQPQGRRGSARLGQSGEAGAGDRPVHRVRRGDGLGRARNAARRQGEDRRLHRRRTPRSRSASSSSSPTRCARPRTPCSPKARTCSPASARRSPGPSDIREQLVASDIPWPTVTLSTGKQVRLDDQGYTLNRDAPNRADRKLVFDTFWAA